MIRPAIVLVLALAASPAGAIDFMTTQECAFIRPGRAPVNTTCIVSGGMQGGTIDICARTPDGDQYAISGPEDGEGGTKFLLQGHAARSFERGDATCYERLDKRLGLLLRLFSKP